jgi:hypothetical protein
MLQFSAISSADCGHGSRPCPSGGAELPSTIRACPYNLVVWPEMVEPVLVDCAAERIVGNSEAAAVSARMYENSQWPIGDFHSFGPLLPPSLRCNAFHNKHPPLRRAYPETFDRLIRRRIVPLARTYGALEFDHHDALRRFAIQHLNLSAAYK